MAVVRPVKDRNPLRLRIVAKPEEHVHILLQRLEIKIPNRPWLPLKPQKKEKPRGGNHAAGLLLSLCLQLDTFTWLLYSHSLEQKVRSDADPRNRWSEVLWDR